LSYTSRCSADDAQASDAAQKDSLKVGVQLKIIDSKSGEQKLDYRRS